MGLYFNRRKAFRAVGPFSANTSNLDGTDTPFTQSSIVFGDIDFWIHFKVKFNSLSPAGHYQRVTKQNSGSPTEFHIRLDPSDNFIWTTKTNEVTSTITAASTSAWYDVYVEVDKTGSTIGISVDNETLVTTTKTVTVSDTAAVFRVGAINTSLGSKLNGGVAGLTCGTGVLSTGNRTTLYNGGDMLCFDDMPAGVKSVALGAWDLANWTGHTGQEVTDQSGNSLPLTNGGSIPFDGTGLTVDCT